jgi:hypothetical protein
MMAMETRFTTQVLDDIAWRIDRHGMSSIPTSTLHDLGLAARNANASAVLVSILDDDTQPPVARARAFGHLAALLSNVFRRQDDTPSTPPCQLAA